MYLNFYIGLLRLSRDVTHPQWRLSMCLRAHEVRSRISRKPLEIEAWAWFQRTTNKKPSYRQDSLPYYLAASSN